jgi:hypothetical protein
MSLEPENIVSIIPLEERFDPSEIVPKGLVWFHPRDWGVHS